jgi:hypothetical protein
MRDSEGIDWAKVLKIDSTSRYETLAKEAQKWNHNHATKASWPVKPEVPLEEELDNEDLLWCNEIHRPAMVLKNAVASRFMRKGKKSAKHVKRRPEIPTCKRTLEAQGDLDKKTDQREKQTERVEKEKGGDTLESSENTTIFHEPFELRTPYSLIPKRKDTEIMDN